VTGTEHPRILRADERSVLFATLSNFVDELRDAAAEMDYDRARGLLSSAVEQYTPINEIDDLVWLSKKDGGESGDSDSIIEFPVKRA
jgi:FlaA1/EpsC-like NDP-sugar epimerase